MTLILHYFHLDNHNETYHEINSSAESEETLCRRQFGETGHFMAPPSEPK